MTDLYAEAEAARIAELSVVLSIRPGNSPLPQVKTIFRMYPFRFVSFVPFSLYPIYCTSYWVHPMYCTSSIVPLFEGFYTEGGINGKGKW